MYSRDMYKQLDDDGYHTGMHDVLLFCKHGILARTKKIHLNDYLIEFVLHSFVVYILYLGWKETGSLHLARTQDRLTYYERTLINAKCVYLAASILRAL